MLPSSKDISAAGTLDIGWDRVATILQTIRRGWSRVRTEPKVRAGTPEVALNVCLRSGMTRVAGPRMLVSMGTETLSPENVGVPDGRVDIAIFFPAILEARHDHDPHAIIECKRVAGSDTRLCREYVVSGIDRFVDGKYGARHAAGFMAGYVESGSVGRAVGGINGYLGRKNRRDEQLGPARGMGDERARRSRHPRTGGPTPVILHHAFLEFE